jgi:hypothetical protein
MRKSWLMCVLLGAVAWGQAAPTTPAPAQAAPAPPAAAQPAPAQQGQAPAQPGPGAKPQVMTAPPDTSAAVPPEAAVITVNGVCPATPKPAAAKGATGTAAKPATDAKPAAPAKPADCKTVITKADFEKLANGVAPNITPQLKKQLASVLPRFIAMSAEAKKRGLDKSERFKETMKFAQMQILTNELQRSIQEEAAKVPPADVEKYYKENPTNFEQYNLDRLFVPRTKQGDAAKEDEAEDADKDKKPTEEQQKAKEEEQKKKQEDAEAAMNKLADDLRARAAAGEDFMKLQKEAFEAAGMKIDSPTVNLPKVRRTGLPPAHAEVFDLKAGEVSKVISDTGGHYIYKVNTKEQLPVDQVKDEIHSTLQNQRTREMMDKVNNSFKSETNEAYFGPPGPMQPPRRPNPRMVPGPVTPNQAPPGAQQQVPPAAPPAAATKPN